MNATTRPRREVPPGGTPVRELAHAIARALTLPDDVTMLAEPAYLRVSRDHARVVLFNMRRIIADRELDDDDLMSIVATIREQTDQLDGNADGDPVDLLREFVGAVIDALTISPNPPTTEMAYLQAARQRARRVLLACRRVVQGTSIEDRDLAAAIEMLGQPDDGHADDAEAGHAPEMIP